MIPLRPTKPALAELAPLLASVREALHPVEIWLFGSRARGDHRPDSDWDLLAVLPDEAPDALTDPLVAWEISRRAGVPATLLATKRSDLAAIWGLPNTLGYNLSRDGVRLVVG
ncbi:MAG TPA: nucleotidyltransferase domain-containing protein [Beijerinckiaceae bacterium]|jgi:predicted nucleotidyltransferase